MLQMKNIMSIEGWIIKQRMHLREYVRGLS